MKLYQWLKFYICGVAIWFIASICIDNPIILPRPDLVFSIMMDQILMPSFYLNILVSFFRVIFSLIISVLLGGFFAFYSHYHKIFKRYFEALLLIIRAIPNVTFVILFLFWADREWTIVLVSLFLLMPLFYQNIIESCTTIYRKNRDIFLVYPQSHFHEVRFGYLPNMKAAISAGILSCSSLGFKVVVMAEILTSVGFGIGRNMQYSRLNIDLASVFAWTIWLLICVSIFNTLIRKVLATFFKEG